MDKQSINLLLKVNGQTFHCDLNIAVKLSPLIQDFYNQVNQNQERSNEIIFDTFIPNTSKDDDISILDKIMNNQEIEITKDNYELSMKIGQHFKIKNIINQCTMFYEFKKIHKIFKNDRNFQLILKLEAIFLEMNEMNIEDTFNQCIEILSIVPNDCFYEFIINIFLNSVKYHSKYHLLIQLLEKIEGKITGIVSSFIEYMLNLIIFIQFSKKVSKRQNVVNNIYSFIYELCTNANCSCLKEEIPINSCYFSVPKELQNIISFDTNKHTIKIIKNDNIKYKYCSNDDLSYIQKEINIVFHDNKNDNDDHKNYDESNKNCCDEGFNHQICNLLESIQRDDFEFFQKSLQNFKDNKNSLFHNQSNNCSLLEYSAFYGAIKCFLFLINNSNVINHNKLLLYATAGGNIEIIHACEQYNCVFDQKSLEISIKYHQHLLMKWLIETKNVKTSQSILKKSIKSYNIFALNYFINLEMSIIKLLLFSISANNRMLFSCLSALVNQNQGTYFKFDLKHIGNNKTALHIACKQNNVEIMKLLLAQDNLDINSIYEVKKEYFIQLRKNIS